MCFFKLKYIQLNVTPQYTEPWHLPANMLIPALTTLRSIVRTEATRFIWFATILLKRSLGDLFNVILKLYCIQPSMPYSYWGSTKRFNLPGLYRRRHLHSQFSNASLKTDTVMYYIYSIENNLYKFILKQCRGNASLQPSE